MVLKINKKDIWFISWVIIYKYILEVIFLQLLFSSYYTGKLVLEKNNIFYILGWVFTIVGGYWATYELKKKKMSSNLMVLLYLLAFVPSMMLAGVVHTSFLGEIIIYFCALLMAFYIIPDFRVKRPRYNIYKPMMNVIMIVLSFLIIYIWYKYAGQRLSLDITEIYIARAKARELSMPIILKYIIVAVKDVMPLIAVYYIYEKKYVTFIWTGILQYLLFLYDGAKTTIISFVLACVCYVVFRYFSNVERQYSFFLAVGCIIGYMEHILTSRMLIVHYFIRRVIVVPAAIHYFYYDFFSKNEIDYFKSSVLRRIGFISEYNDLGIPRTLGKIYENNDFITVVNGLFSDAFANLGNIGLIVMPILIVLVIKVFQAVSYDLPISVVAACFIPITFTIMGSSFFGYFITHGFLAIIIILYLWPRKEMVR